MTTSHSEPMRLRDYQQRAIDSIQSGFDKFDRQLAVLPTGSGKTIVFSHLASTIQPKRTLILAHREELITQAVDKLRSATGIEAGVERADQRASLDDPVVVGSVQTFMREKRRDRWPEDHFDLVVVDEAHHTLADSYLSTLGHFGSHAKVLGVTATPDRGDKRNLGRYYDDIACEVSLVELISQGWLSKIMVKTVPLAIDLEDVRTTAGDFNADDVSHAIEPLLDEIVTALLDHRDRKILVFLPLISTSKMFVEICRARGMAAEHVDGTSPDRKEILERFHTGETRVLANAMLLTEGYDEPSVDCIVCLRPTKVRALYSQIIGRGTRIHPEKENLLVLDFLWQSDEHSLIRPAHLVAEDDEQAAAITEHLGYEDEEASLEEAMEAVAADRTRKLRERLANNRRRSTRLFDPVELAVTLNDAALADYTPTMEWHHDLPSPKQLAFLARAGLDTATIHYRGHASVLIDRIITRRNLELATPKQVRLMRRLGHERPETATFKEASAYIDKRLGQLA